MNFFKRWFSKGKLQNTLSTPVQAVEQRTDSNDRVEELVWTLLENPMGFSMPAPYGWVFQQKSPEVILSPEDYYIISDGVNNIVSPAITLLAGPIPPGGADRGMQKVADFQKKRFSKYNEHEKEWIQLNCGTRALYTRFSYIKARTPFTALNIAVCSSNMLFIFNISGATADIERYDQANLKELLTDFYPGS